jgi:hypothetical protein
MPVTRRLVGFVGGVRSRPAETDDTPKIKAITSTNAVRVENLAIVRLIILFFLSITNRFLSTSRKLTEYPKTGGRSRPPVFGPLLVVSRSTDSKFWKQLTTGEHCISGQEIQATFPYPKQKDL